MKTKLGRLFKLSAAFLGVLALVLLYNSDGMASEHAPEHAPAHTPAHATEHSPAHQDSHKTAQIADAHHSEKQEQKSSFVQWFVSNYYTKPFHEVWSDFKEKVDHMRILDEENERLKSTLAKSDSENAILKTKVTEKNVQEHLASQKHDVEAETGLNHGRVIEDLKKFNGDLLAMTPRERYEQSVLAFKSEDFETASIGFLSVLRDKEHPEYSNTNNYLMAGISLYKVKNFKSAEKIFSKILADHGRTIASVADKNIAPQVMVWLSLCRSRVGDTAGARHVVHELIQKYPESNEAKKLNRLERF